MRAGVAQLAKDGCLCLEDAGRTQRLRDLADVLIAAPGRFRPLPETEVGETRLVDLPPAAAAAPEGLVELGTERPDPATLSLTEADVILSAGAAVSDWPLFHRLARALGAAEAGSRVVCDAGHLPRDRQVGASGTLVAPRCYLALGISGAVQHLQGIAECRKVAAVNSDPHAPMVARADLAVVADTTEVMRALVERLERGA